MTEKILTGDQAIACGALEAGVNVVIGYPGSPATKVFESILELRVCTVRQPLGGNCESRY